MPKQEMVVVAVRLAKRDEIAGVQFQVWSDVEGLDVVDLNWPAQTADGAGGEQL
jgi:hypothetical protein